MPEIQSLIARAQTLGQKVDWWNSAMLCALAVAAIAAIAVGVATRKVVINSKELSAVQEQLNLALRGKVATLEISAADAGQQLAGLQKDAADATAAS